MAARRGAATVGQQAMREIDPERIARLRTFFARASVATRLLQSRLALPLTYPLNTSTMGMMPDGKPDWNEEEIKRGLAHVTPIVSGMSKVTSVLKGAQALSYYQGGHTRHVAPDPVQEKAQEQDIRLNTIRPQRPRGANYGRGPGHIVTKQAQGTGWEDVASGRTVDSPLNRFTNDPFEDTPNLNEKPADWKSRTKWDKRRSGSQ